MLERAVLALAQNGGAGEKNGEHGDVVDDLIDRHEPALLHVRIEAGSTLEPDQVPVARTVSVTPEGLNFARHDLVDVSRSPTRLAHGRRIGRDFNRRLLSL